ncbi:MAG: hypothetical protein M3Z11_03370 [Candidatus Dormibacteraeota bacterium]|nr:hypothetical protein [Candidatus Dormibacteraeota bacterium]
MDQDGYGYKATEKAIDRLLEDARTLSPAGIERAAWGWDRHEEPVNMQRFREAEKMALHALEQANRGDTWEKARRDVLELTEGRLSVVSWKVEHGDKGHKAEHAALGAAMGVLVKDRIDHAHYATLVQPMAEALPWLLPEVPPEPRRR